MTQQLALSEMVTTTRAHVEAVAWYHGHLPILDKGWMTYTRQLPNGLGELIYRAWVGEAA